MNAASKVSLVTPQMRAAPTREARDSLTKMDDCNWEDLAVDFAENLRETQKRVQHDRARGFNVYPPESEVFRALELTQCHQTKVVIVGQDPYHGARDGQSQADGLCFSVRPGLPIPPSLRNIREELRTDQPHVEIPDHGSLEAWASRGVLLLNTILTVREGKARSHARMGWEPFTDQIIRVLSDKRSRVVFMLWGRDAQKKAELIDESRHAIIRSSHPSDLSARRPCGDSPPFLGSRPFSRANEVLGAGQEGIDWSMG